MNISKQQAFTLIELMVVLVIIAILVGITIPVARHISKRSQEARERAQRIMIESGLEEYRSKYGEYPITPTFQGKTNALSAVGNHYPLDGFPTECYLIDPSKPYTQYTNVIISAVWPTKENIPGANQPVDYSLTYPLMLRQSLNNERPLVEFPYITINYIAWTGMDLGEAERTIWSFDSDGNPVSSTVVGLRGAPVNRPLALNPSTGRQLAYESDGLNYELKFP